MGVPARPRCGCREVTLGLSKMERGASRVGQIHALSGGEAAPSTAAPELGREQVQIPGPGLGAGDLVWQPEPCVNKKKPSLQPPALARD